MFHSFFQFSCKVKVLISLFTFFQFYSVVCRDSKVDNFADFLFFLVDIIIIIIIIIIIQQTTRIYNWSGMKRYIWPNLHFPTSKKLTTDFCSSIENSDVPPFWNASKQIFLRD